MDKNVIVKPITCLLSLKLNLEQGRPSLLKTVTQGSRSMFYHRNVGRVYTLVHNTVVNTFLRSTIYSTPNEV